MCLTIVHFASGFCVYQDLSLLAPRAIRYERLNALRANSVRPLVVGFRDNYGELARGGVPTVGTRSGRRVAPLSHFATKVTLEILTLTLPLA